MRAAFAEVLPEDTMTLLHDYFTNQKVRSRTSGLLRHPGQPGGRHGHDALADGRLSPRL